MPETKLKDLYKGKCIDDLDHKVPKFKEKKAMMLCSSAVKLQDKAMEDLRKGDQESAYISLMKFLAVVDQLKTAPDYPNQKKNVVASLTRDMVNRALDSAEKLKRDLVQRYEMENQMRKRNEFEEQAMVRQKIDSDRLRAKESQQIYIQPVSGLPHVDDVSIKCTRLFEMLRDGSKKILILDARSEADYKESHIKDPRCINIPEECIKAGHTANKLEKNLPPESMHLWGERKFMDLIVILDWSSNDFVPGKTLHTLKTIFMKWDPEVVYKQAPICLEGGYEDWLLKYPSWCTNPHVAPPSHHTQLDDLLNEINYPVLNDSMSPVENKQMFDRSFKPEPRGAYFPPVSVLNNPGVDRSSKAAALQTYEKNSKEIKDILEKQEKLAVASLSIEKERIIAEENWQEMRTATEVEPEEGKHSEPELKEQEIISKLMFLENNQIDTTSEITRLKEVLEKMRNESDLSHTTNSSLSPGSPGYSPNANSRLELSDGSSNYPKEDSLDLEEEEREERQRLAEEAERKIGEMEREKEALNSRRKAMEEDRLKSLAETMKKKQLLFKLQQQEEGDTIPLKGDGGAALNRSHSTPNIVQLMDEDDPMAPVKTPQFDRSTKPSHRPLDSNPPRQRDFQGVYGRVGRGLTGLKNLGNTCYMNSIMQCLSNTSVLTTYFCEGNYKQDVRGAQMCVGSGKTSAGTRGAVAEEVAAVVRHLWSEQFRFISAKDLRNVVGRHQAMFRGIEQQDSHEFLTILMDWLHNDLQTPTRQHIHMDTLTPSEKAWLDYTKSRESPILRLFYGQMKSTVKCLECGKESVTHDSFSNLSLELPAHANKCNLSDCLELYLKDERILGWNCPACKQKRDAIKKLDISRLPPILVIHFKRFYVDTKDYVSNTYRKKLTNIDFPLQNLDMGQFSLQSYRDRKNTIYNLYGVSNHYGSMEGGHYTAYCKSSVYSKWYKFDDHVVTEISPSDVKSSAAYILFYTSVSEEMNH